VKEPENRRGRFTISTDRARLERARIHEFLSTSYWAPGIPREVVDRSIEGSLCFGVYDGEAQVGFARVITDGATFAYVADVFVLESHRGQGLGVWLMETIRAHPDLQGLRRWSLVTRDAHALYRRVGFADVSNPGRWMEIVDRDVYRLTGTSSRPSPPAAHPEGEERGVVNAPADWWRTFFEGLAVRFWDAALPESMTAEDTAFLWKHLGLRAGSRVLDVPCGSGRLTRPLAAAGCRMTGVDISAESLAAARAGDGGAIHWVEAEMRELPWHEEFDAAFCFGNSFGFLDDRGNAEFLAAVARTLLPGGRFALDYGQTAECVLPRLEPRQESEIGGFHFVEETRYDPAAARIENRFTFARDGQTETKLASQRAYALAETTRLLEDAGLSVRRLFGSAREEPFSTGSPRLLVVAEKKA